MGTQIIKMKAVLSCLVHWASRAGTRDYCSALAALVGPVQNIFFLAVPLSPSPSQLGRQPCWVAPVSYCVSLGISNPNPHQWSHFLTITSDFFLDKKATVAEKLVFFLSIFFGSVSQFQNFYFIQGFCLIVYT
jgi:hypothetical protein